MILYCIAELNLLTVPNTAVTMLYEQKISTLKHKQLELDSFGNLHVHYNSPPIRHKRIEKNVPIDVHLSKVRAQRRKKRKRRIEEEEEEERKKPHRYWPLSMLNDMGKNMYYTWGLHDSAMGTHSRLVLDPVVLSC